MLHRVYKRPGEPGQKVKPAQTGLATTLKIMGRACSASGLHFETSRLGSRQPLVLNIASLLHHFDVRLHLLFELRSARKSLNELVRLEC